MPRQVRCSGAVLSGALFDMVSSQTDLEGLCFGQHLSYGMRSTGDSQETAIVQQEVLGLQAFTPTGPPFSFYDGAGHIDQAELQKHVGSKQGKEVVGWFKFRRHSTLTPSYRERLVHRELLRTLKVKPEKFLFVILTADWNEQRSTHTFRYNVTIYDDGTDSFFNTELKVANLDQSSHDGYSALSIPTVSSTPREGGLVDAYATIIGHLQAQVGGSQLTADARAAEGAFQGTVDEIDKLAGRLGNANQEIEALENEIKMLEQGASSPPLTAADTGYEVDDDDGDDGGGGRGKGADMSNSMDADVGGREDGGGGGGGGGGSGGVGGGGVGGSQDSDVVSVDLAMSQSQGDSGDGDGGGGGGGGSLDGGGGGGGGGSVDASPRSKLPATNPFARGKSPEFE